MEEEELKTIRKVLKDIKEDRQETLKDYKWWKKQESKLLGKDCNQVATLKIGGKNDSF